MGLRGLQVRTLSDLSLTDGAYVSESGDQWCGFIVGDLFGGPITLDSLVFISIVGLTKKILHFK